jgi:hypothetical protein
MAASTGYNHIDPLKFFIGLTVVTVPAWYLGANGSEKMAWSYVSLIVIMFAVFNYQGLSNFTAVINSKLSKGA